MSQIKRTLEAIFIKSISDVPQTEAPAAANWDARVAMPRQDFCLRVSNTELSRLFRLWKLQISFSALLFICPRSVESRFKRRLG